MKVILKEKVKSLGNVGEIHNVSAGYARNFLIRNNLATVADEANTKSLNDQKKALAKKIAGEKDAATALKGKLDGFTLKIEKKVGGSGRLFGTVTTAEVAEGLKSNGIEIEKRLIVIETPVKQLGTFPIKAKLFDDVEAVFNVQVEQNAKQAIEDAKQAKLKKEAKAKREAQKAEEAALEAKAETDGEEAQTQESV